MIRATERTAFGRHGLIVGLRYPVVPVGVVSVRHRGSGSGAGRAQNETGR